MRVRGDKRLINIRFKDGNVKRLVRSEAHDIVDSGKARFISKTLYKAAVAGVKANPKMADADVKTKIAEARLSERKKRDAAAKKKAEKKTSEETPQKKKKRGKRDK